ncbi:uncharacterized protein JCM6883_003828 [Sporobolomyces salmoneus]|uniref:uncharacterized protein n=1 Tax=Sporobolomyces salmoneus TaxID=183962 RepID=UPI00316B7272
MPFGRFRTHSPEATSSSSTQNSSTRPDPEGSKVQLSPLRTATQSTNSSSTSDEPSSPRSSISSRAFPLSRLHAAVSRGASSSSQSTRNLPEPDTPLALAQEAISTILTVPGPSIEELRRDYFPRLFHEAYSHRANTREHGLKELEELITRFRSKFESMRVRFRSHIIDQDGTASLQVAAVGLTYDIIAVPRHQHQKGEHRRDVEERRSQVMAIVKIYEGRLAQTDLCLDTTPFQDEHSGPQLNQCTIM